jgi:hypothetical protein
MKNNLKNIIIVSSLAGLLAIPIGCDKINNLTSLFSKDKIFQEQIKERCSSIDQTKTEQGETKQEYRFVSLEGRYSVPINACEKEELNFTTNSSIDQIANHIKSIAKEDNWVYTFSSSYKDQYSKGSGAEQFWKFYEDKQILAQINIAWNYPSYKNQSLDDICHDILILNPIIEGNELIEKEYIKIDNNPALKCFLYGKVNNDLIVTRHNGKNYGIVFSSIKINVKNVKEDPEGSFEKFEKGLRFID